MTNSEWKANNWLRRNLGPTYEAVIERRMFPMKQFNGEIKKEIEQVTAEQIQELARNIFVNETLNLAVVGKSDNPAEFESILKI